MKNIAIFGSPRSGKSTLAKMIVRKYPRYQIISGDNIRFAFQNVLPQNQINETGGAGMLEDFPNFLAFLFHENIETYKGELNFIVETCDITPEKAQKLFCTKDTLILFLGVSKQTIDNYFREIRQSQTKKDWTYAISDDDILNNCQRFILKSQENVQKCRDLGIWYVDTSFNREQVLRDTFAKISEIINYNTKTQK